MLGTGGLPQESGGNAISVKHTANSVIEPESHLIVDSEDAVSDLNCSKDVKIEGLEVEEGKPEPPKLKRINSRRSAVFTTGYKMEGGTKVYTSEADIIESLEKKSKENQSIIEVEGETITTDNLGEDEGDITPHEKGKEEEEEPVGPSDFHILAVIGQGAFGRVYQVVYKRTGKVYAMKVLDKKFTIKKKNVERTKIERDIMTKVNHPFVITLKFAFLSEKWIYLVMEYLCGGELFFQLTKEGLLLEKVARFYIAEMILAVEYLHHNGIVHRDLKPENVLLDRDGHIRLTDFGLAKEVAPDFSSKSICGTYEYMAPEMVAKSGYNKSVDFWALGALLWEMLVGEAPFRASDTPSLLRKILREKLKFPSWMSPACISLLRGMLTRNPLQRLGCKKGNMFAIGGVTELKQHKFFDGLDWNALERKEITPPFKPSLKHIFDMNNFCASFTDQNVRASVSETPRINCDDEFEGFDFTSVSFNCRSRSDSVSLKVPDELMGDMTENPDRFFKSVSTRQKECIIIPSPADVAKMQKPQNNNNNNNKKNKRKNNKKKKKAVVPVQKGFILVADIPEPGVTIVDDQKDNNNNNNNDNDDDTIQKKKDNASDNNNNSNSKKVADSWLSVKDNKPITTIPIINKNIENIKLSSTKPISSLASPQKFAAYVPPSRRVSPTKSTTQQKTTPTSGQFAWESTSSEPVLSKGDFPTLGNSTATAKRPWGTSASTSRSKWGAKPVSKPIVSTTLEKAKPVLSTNSNILSGSNSTINSLAANNSEKEPVSKTVGWGSKPAWGSTNTKPVVAATKTTQVTPPAIVSPSARLPTLPSRAAISVARENVVQSSRLPYGSTPSNTSEISKQDIFSNDDPVLSKAVPQKKLRGAWGK